MLEIFLRLTSLRFLGKLKRIMSYFLQGEFTFLGFSESTEADFTSY